MLTRGPRFFTPQETGPPLAWGTAPLSHQAVEPHQSAFPTRCTCFGKPLDQIADRIAGAPDIRDDVVDFVLERLRAWYADDGVATETFNAVLARRPTRLVDFDRRVHACRAFADLPAAESLAAAKELLGDDRVVAFLARPSLSDDQRLEFLQGLFAKVAGEQSVFAGRSDHGTNFFRLLLENRRVAVLPEIADRFEALKADLENRVDVTVTSAGPVSERQIDEISTALRERLGRDVNIEMKIDENLIGGAVIRAGDVVIDGSMRARLEGPAAWRICWP